MDAVQLFQILGFSGILGLLLLLCYIALSLELALGNRAIAFLKNIPPALDENLPQISIIIPARNEADTVEKALESVINVDYPNREIIVLNDRSTDDTGNILEAMARRFPMLKIVHITELPSGWLGKNHALWVGASQASGEYLLFTDADIHFDTSTLRRAMTFVREKSLDHLAVLLQVIYEGWALNVLIGTFIIFFNIRNRPWKARNPKSPYYVGIGAFNLVKKSAYEVLGTHQSIAMRPDDDMKLGQRVKQLNFRQDVLFGSDMVQVRWYPSAKAFINGLLKNTFPFMEYSVLFTLLGVFGVFLFDVFPFIIVWFSSGAQQAIYAAIIFVFALFYWDNSKYAQTSPWGWIGFPFAALAFNYIMLASMWKTLSQGGIYWRETFYPLSELKKNTV